MTKMVKDILVAAFAVSTLVGCSSGHSNSGGHQVAPVPEEDQLTAFVNPRPAFTKSQWEAMPEGQRLYQRWCSFCHEPGPGHAGTQMLAQLRGKEFSVIKENKNLTPDYVKSVVRNGLQMMPPFRTTEISDNELDALANYVGRGGKQ